MATRRIKPLVRLILAVIFAIIIVSAVQQFFFLPVGVKGPSMLPTIRQNGDTAYIIKFGYTLKHNDIIVFYRPMNEEAENMINPAQDKVSITEFFQNIFRFKKQTDPGHEAPEEGNFLCVIKRVIGLPNDTVKILDGVLFLNGVELNDFSMAGVQDMAEITVGEGEYFVLGDNRSNSYDSEDYGPIKEEWILGKVVMLVSRGDVFNVRFV